MQHDDGLFIQRHEIEPFRRKLRREVRAIVDNMAITLTGRDRVRFNDLGTKKSGKPGSSCPLNISAHDHYEELHTNLTAAVRDVLETRGLTYDGDPSTVGMAQWIDQNVMALALTEGGDDHRLAILDSIAECMEDIDLPTERSIVIDESRVQAANRWIGTAGQIERMAPKLGDIAKGLNKRRVETLKKRGTLIPCAQDGEGESVVFFYRLGDALDAHKNVSQRKKTA